jgi:hypothetical protein
VRVVCDGLFIQLLSATPADGWAAMVIARGPVNVEVHFVRPGQETSVTAVCFGQPVRYFGELVPTKP